MKRNKAVFIALAALLPLGFLACPAEEAQRGLPTATAAFTPGTFTASYGEAGVPGWRQAPLVVDVTFAEDQITDIEIVSHGESLHAAGWWFRAFPAVTDQILIRQSTRDIDAFTGATLTRNAFVNAVNDAIAQAGASPEDLVPQMSDAPLYGDLFVPGFHVVTVPAGAMDIDGAPLTAATPEERVMLYSPDVDMTLRVSVGRNEFHVYEGGAFGLGQGAGGHGEPIAVNPARIEDGAWGGWWFSQIAAQQINDRQATRGLDISVGATRSAAAVVWGVEQALLAAGGDPAALAPRQVPPVQWRRNPATPYAPFFVPGHYAVTAQGIGGDIALTVTLDRSLVRRIAVDSHSEPEYVWSAVWPGLRDAIYRAIYPQSLDDGVESFWYYLRESYRAENRVMYGGDDLEEAARVHPAAATVSAIVEAVREAFALADPGDL